MTDPSPIGDEMLRDVRRLMGVADGNVEPGVDEAIRRAWKIGYRSRLGLADSAAAQLRFGPNVSGATP